MNDAVQTPLKAPVKPKDKVVGQTAGYAVTNQKKTDKQGKSVPQGKAAKEQEPVHDELAAKAEEEKLMTEIRTTAEAADKQALEAIQNSLKEAKRSVFEPELPPDVEDAGVVNPTKAAEAVVEKGTTIDLPIDEETYKKGLRAKVRGKSEGKSFVGVASLTALALWIGRLLKLAHKHTMRVVFRREK